MLARIGITAKIWLSVGVFIVGLVLSAFLDQVHGWSTERELRNTTAALLPAVESTQEADVAFQQMARSFSTAIMTQDAGMLDQAVQQGRSAAALLRTVAATSALGPRARSAGDLAASIERFLDDAKVSYAAALSNSTMSRETEEKMQDLAARSEQLRTAVESQKAPVLAELKTSLGQVQARARGQRISALIVFAITLLVAALLVHTTVRRGIVAPLLVVIRGVQTAAADAARESEAMAKSGEKVACDSRDQASSVEETSAVLEQISASASENATCAAQADGLMKDARAKVDDVAHSMDRLTVSMDAITKSSNEVAQVLKSIDEIAFHTNILALNAAVEAARAGSVGAGFSVVAAEVRSLAQRAAEAARHSADIVERTITDVRKGAELVAAAHSGFGQVSSSIAESGEVVGRIVTTSNEQSRGVASIGQAISRIQAVTQSNAEQARQTAQSTAQMADHVQTTQTHLRELVQVMGLAG